MSRSGRNSDGGSRRARRRSSGPVQVPDARSEAYRSIAASLNRTADEQQLRRTAIEIGKAMHDLVYSKTLGLDAEQREIGDRATVAYLTWWCERNGLDISDLPTKSTVHATPGHPLRKGDQE